MNIPFQEYSNQALPYWYWLGDGVAPESRVVVVCPNNHHSRLKPAHQIDRQGNVSPSVICSEPKCNFHETITLLKYRQ